MFLPISAARVAVGLKVLCCLGICKLIVYTMLLYYASGRRGVCGLSGSFGGKEKCRTRPVTIFALVARYLSRGVSLLCLMGTVYSIVCWPCYATRKIFAILRLFASSSTRLPQCLTGLLIGEKFWWAFTLLILYQ